MSSAERFGTRLKEWRQHRRLSQDTLGEMVGADGPRIHRLEKGTENPTLETLDKIADALQVDVSVFFDPRPEEEPGSVGRVEANPVFAEVLARLDAKTPAEDSWRGDVLKAEDALLEAVAALNRALRRSPDSGEPLAPTAKARR